MTEQKYLKDTITVDCGMSTAWAYWSGTNRPETGEFRKASYILKDWYLIRNFLSNQMDGLLRKKRPDIVYLEGTQKYASLISQTAIDKGSLFQLSYLVGRYEECCFKHGVACKIINAPQWKGQMTKEITAEKIRMLNGMTYPTEHIMDAVGIGFGVIGAFQWEIRK